MIELRPHHLLCYAFYEGKGYNDTFIKNMDQIYKRLNNERVLIVKGCDILCQSCPNQTIKEKCATQELVLKLDQKVIEQFNIEIGNSYDYMEWKQTLIETLDDQLFKQLCGECKWYVFKVCKLEKLKTNQSIKKDIS